MLFVKKWKRLLPKYVIIKRDYDRIIKKSLMIKRLIKNAFDYCYFYYRNIFAKISLLKRYLRSRVIKYE